MDFIIELPWSEGHDFISVVEDQLMKMRNCIAYQRMISPFNLGEMFAKYIQ
jgi:hypothetical protein